MDSKTAYILLDAEVIIHFYKADRLSLLQELYKGRLLVLDFVLEELLRNKTIAPYVENFLPVPEQHSSQQQFEGYQAILRSVRHSLPYNNGYSRHSIQEGNNIRQRM